MWKRGLSPFPHFHIHVSTVWNKVLDFGLVFAGDGESCLSYRYCVLRFQFRVFAIYQEGPVNADESRPQHRLPSGDSGTVIQGTAIERMDNHLRIT